MQLNSLRDLFLHELRGAYRMETRLVRILDQMADNATNDQLAQGFADHAEETATHVERVEQVFAALDSEPEERECPLVEALDEERRTVEESVEDPDLLDMAYLGAGMKTERIEATTYDSLIQIAGKLDLGEDVVDPLEANRESEEDALDELQLLAGASELKSLWDRLTP